MKLQNQLVFGQLQLVGYRPFSSCLRAACSGLNELHGSKLLSNWSGVVVSYVCARNLLPDNLLQVRVCPLQLVGVVLACALYTTGFAAALHTVLVLEAEHLWPFADE